MYKKINKNPLTSSLLIVLQLLRGRRYLTGLLSWRNSAMQLEFFDSPFGYIIPLKAPDFVLMATAISFELQSIFIFSSNSRVSENRERNFIF